uniref:Uncharacterized protein n=1 Tax=Arundo donax TaxID=35708 RepID=A0A0A9BAF7_ARUDO
MTQNRQILIKKHKLKSPQPRAARQALHVSSHLRGGTLSFRVTNAVLWRVGLSGLADYWISGTRSLLHTCQFSAVAVFLAGICRGLGLVTCMSILQRFFSFA